MIALLRTVGRATGGYVVTAVPKLLDRFGLVDERRGTEAVELAWPRSISGLARYSMRTADLVMIGWALGTTGISALAFGFTIYKVLKQFGIGFSAATLSLVSQYYGNGEYERASFVLKQSVLLAVAFTVPITAVTIVLAEAMIVGLGAATDVAALGGVYLQLLAVGFGFQFFNLVCGRAYAGIGDTVTPMVIRSVSAVGNIGLNTVLIFGLGPFPALGVVGAGLGTIVATAFGSLAFVAHLTLLEPDLSFRAPNRHWDAAIVAQIVSIGTPAIGRKLSQTLVQVPLLAIVALFGTGIVAAYEISRRAFQLARTPMWGLNFSASVLVGQSVGDGDFELATVYGREVTILSIVILLPVFLLILVFPGPIGRVFLDDPDTLELVEVLLRVLAIGGIGYTIDEALSGALTGAGDTRWPLYGTLVGLYGVLLPGAYVLGVVLGLGIVGVAIALLAEFYVPAAINVYRYNSGAWTAAKVTDD